MPNSIPDWLSNNPKTILRVPTVTRTQELPYEELTWEDFERLCYRLASMEADVAHCQIYGVKGDTQNGIDIFARKPNTTKYTVYQCKREKSFAPKKIKEAVSTFISGDWIAKTECFVLCTQESLQTKLRTDAIEEKARLLASSNVSLIPWDAPKLNTLMKSHPMLVDDFFGREWVKCFCGQEAANSLLPKLSQERTTAFREWVAKTTESYSVPGLGVEMSISRAWIELQTMNDLKDRAQTSKSFEKQIENYNEWFRMGESRDRSDTFKAHEMLKGPSKCLVIGGPGSGKSTLCKRIGHDATKQGEIVIYVRLKRVQQQMARGITFEDAVLNEATDGFNPTLEERDWFSRNVDLFIADGLDECDPDRREMSNNIKKWLEGRGKVSSIITTRPVGHHSSLLTGFNSFELLPLDDSAIEVHSKALFVEAMDNKKEATACWVKFISDVSADSKNGRSIASRNPLLLGFLVRMAVDGVAISENRVHLFDQVFKLMLNAATPSCKSQSSVSPEFANHAIDTAAFLLISKPNMQLDDLVVAAVKTPIMDVEPKEFRAAMTYWEKRRAIERISAGHLSAILFVHPALGEFAAARYIARMKSSEFMEWFLASRRKASWRQSILLASQIDDDRLITQLVSHDDMNDPCSIETTIAAEALAESTDLSQHSVKGIIDLLTRRLTSHNPVISLESAQALLPLSEHIKEEVFIVIAALLQHRQEWTKLAALALVVKSSYFENYIEEFELWLREFRGTSGYIFSNRGFSPDPWTPEQAPELEKELIEVGLPKMLKCRSGEKINDYFKNGRDWTSGFSMATISTITSSLKDAGFKELAEEIDHSICSKYSDINWKGQLQLNSSDPALIEAISLAAGLVGVEPAQGDFNDTVWIKAISKALRLGDCPTNQGCYLREKIYFDQTIEVLKGVIGCLSIDLEELDREIAIAKYTLQESGNLLSLYGSSIPKTIDWNRALHLELNVENLAKALDHPFYPTAYGAAVLLDGGAADEELKSIVECVLATGGRQAVRFASFLSVTAMEVDFKDRTLEYLRSEIRPGYEYLVEMLLRNIDCEYLSTLSSDFHSWLKHEDPDFVSHVSKCIDEQFDVLPENIINLLDDSFEFWTQQGTWCRKHKIKTREDSCPECNVMLSCPRQHLLNLLFKGKLITTVQLIEYFNDPQIYVSGNAKKLFIQEAAENPLLVKEALNQILQGAVPISFLNDLSDLSANTLQQNKTVFEKLLKSSNEAIRKAAINSLGGSWMSGDEAIVWAKGFVTSNLSEERVGATKILRLLMNR